MDKFIQSSQQRLQNQSQTQQAKDKQRHYDNTILGKRKIQQHTLIKTTEKRQTFNVDFQEGGEKTDEATEGGDGYYGGEAYQQKRFEEERRFDPGWPRPHEPPVGGQFICKDAANSIQSLSKSQQISSNSILLNSEKIIQTHSNKEQQPNKSSSQNSPLSFFEIDNLNLTTKEDSPFLSLLTRNNSNTDEFKTNSTFSSDVSEDTKKKRDNKYQDKQDKVVCLGCNTKYHKLKTQELCHNCYKIYEAVDTFVTSNQGYFELDLKKCRFKLTCHRRHTWKTDFKTKQVKKWCKACKKSDKEEKKQYLKQQEEERQARFAQRQQQLFEQAKTSYQEHASYWDTYEHYEVGPAAAEVGQKLAAFLQQGEETEDQAYTVEQQTTAVEYVLGTHYNDFVQYFISLRERRESVFRKLAKVLHPDKNSHPQAKEAFQKLSNTRSSLRLMQISQDELLFGAEEDLFCCQPLLFVA